MSDPLRIPLAEVPILLRDDAAYGHRSPFSFSEDDSVLSGLVKSVRPVLRLVERFDIEPCSDFPAK